MLLSLSEKGVSVSVSAGAVVGRIFTWSVAVGRSVCLRLEARSHFLLLLSRIELSGAGWSGVEGHL